MNVIQLIRVLSAFSVYGWMLFSWLYHSYLMTLHQTAFILYGLLGVGIVANVVGLLFSVSKKNSSVKNLPIYFRLSFLWQGILALALIFTHIYNYRLDGISAATLPIDLALMTVSQGLLFLAFVVGFGLELEIFRSLRSPVLVRYDLLSQNGGHWALLGIVFLTFLSANYLFRHYNQAWDLSFNRWGKMSEETVKVADQTGHEFTVYLLFEHGARFRTMSRHYLAPLEAMAHVQIVEADYARSAEIQRILPNQQNGRIVIRRSDGRQAEVDLISASRSSREMFFKNLDKTFNLSLKQVVLQKSTIGFTVVNGEYNWELGVGRPDEKLTRLQADLLSANYEVVSLYQSAWSEEEYENSLAKLDAIFIVGPSKSFSDSQIDFLERFHNGGGHIFIFAEPERFPKSGNALNTWLEGKGLQLSRNRLMSRKVFFKDDRDGKSYGNVYANVSRPGDFRWGVAGGTRKTIVMRYPGYFTILDRKDLKQYRFLEGFRPDQVEVVRPALDPLPREWRTSVLLDFRQNQSAGKIYVFADATMLTDKLALLVRNTDQIVSLLDGAVARLRSTGRYYSSKFDRMITIGSGRRAWMSYVVFSLIPLLWLFWAVGYFYLIPGRRKALGDERSRGECDAT